MSDPGRDGKDHLPTEVCRADHQRVADKRQNDGETTTAAGQPDEPRNQVDDKDDRVDQAVGDTDTTLTVDGLVPIGISGNSRAEGGHDTNEDRHVCRGAPALALIEEIDDVEEDGERPGAQRDVGDDGMQRMAHPGPGDEGLRPMAGRAEQLLEAATRFWRETSDRPQPPWRSVKPLIGWPLTGALRYSGAV